MVFFPFLLSCSVSCITEDDDDDDDDDENGDELLSFFQIGGDCNAPEGMVPYLGGSINNHKFVIC